MVDILTKKAIDTTRIMEFMTSNDFAGASVVFLGKIRQNAYTSQVLKVEYEAFEELAEKTILDIKEKAMRIWPVLEIHIQHRLGSLDVGDIAVAIVVLGGHRDEAYRASRFVIDRIKHQVPIWKKEYFKDGSSKWGVCNHSGGDSKTRITQPFAENDLFREMISESMMDGLVCHD